MTEEPGRHRGERLPTVPTVIVFDVNETLSDTAALGEVFAAEGLPAASATTWFAQVLRDGFALALTGDNVRFADVAAALLPADLSPDGVERVLSAFSRLPLHPDVVPGLSRLAEAGHRLVCLSNGATEVSEELLRANGLADRVERCLSVADAPHWKPGRRSYAYAADRCGVAIGELLLVAVHPWDVNGASAAGARTAWLNRSGADYPAFFRPPDVVVASLTELLVG